MAKSIKTLQMKAANIEHQIREYRVKSLLMKLADMKKKSKVIKDLQFKLENKLHLIKISKDQIDDILDNLEAFIE